MKTQPTYLRLDLKLLERLDRMKQERYCSRTVLINQAIRKFLDSEEEKNESLETGL